MGCPSKHPAQFWERAVELVRSSDKPLARVAQVLGINDTTLGNWVNADTAEWRVTGATGLPPLTAAERAEPARFRQENVTLRTERDIVKKAPAFFVKESTR